MTHILVTFPWGWMVEYSSWTTVNANRLVLGITGAKIEEVETLPAGVYRPDVGHFADWVENELSAIMDEINRELEANNMETCVICGVEFDEEEDGGVCNACGKFVCDDCLRVPADVSDEESVDYCLKCYVQAGFAEVWEVDYVTVHGDGGTIRLDTVPKVHPMRIPGYARARVPLLQDVTGWRKVRF